MKKLLGLSLVVLVGLLMVIGCTQVNPGGGSSDTTETTTTIPEDRNPTMSLSEAFDVTGAKAIASAISSSSSTAAGSAIKAMQDGTATELVKIDDEGETSSVYSEDFALSWHPPINCIETGPDGAIYVGFEWAFWVNYTNSDGTSVEGDVAFFKITPDGTISVVDDDIAGVGNWYGGSENGELPRKQVQWDDDGNLYYLAKDRDNGRSILKRKKIDGTIEQIGNTQMEARDFLVTDNGFVLFHGSEVGNWSIEWLRIYEPTNLSSNFVFYNDGQGYLRAYYYLVVGGDSYVFLVGDNITLLDASGREVRYTGIIRVAISAATGVPGTVTALYDDLNMYSDAYSTIGDRLNSGFWDHQAQSNQRFFAVDDTNMTIIPLSLEAGVTEDTIRAYIRKQYQSTTVDTLDDLAFTGISVEAWQLTETLNSTVAAHVSGLTWAEWRIENGLNNVSFGNAKQLIANASGEIFAVMRLDDWGAGTSNGDKLFKITNISGEAEMTAYPQDEATYYKRMSKVRIYGDYAYYLSQKVGQYKIFRVDTTDNTSVPEDMISSRSGIEIFSYNYDETGGPDLIFDFYDPDDNSSNFARKNLATGVLIVSPIAEFTLTDIVPFAAR
ncbi:MAG: hypothetical protein ABH823_02800 [bacterium]